jgi:hypothetical protein
MYLYTVAPIKIGTHPYYVLYDYALNSVSYMFVIECE